MPKRKAKKSPRPPDSWGSLTDHELARLSPSARDAVVNLGAPECFPAPQPHQIVSNHQQLTVTAQSIAAALVVRLREVVPSQIVLGARDGDVWAQHRDEEQPLRFSLRELIDQPVGQFFANTRTAVIHACEDLTEMIAIDLESDWPAPGTSVQVSVDVRGVTVIWSDRLAPVLDLGMIPWETMAGSPGK